MITNSDTSRMFKQLLCDGQVVPNFIMCKHCKTVMAYSSGRGWNRMNRHLNTCLRGGAWPADDGPVKCKISTNAKCDTKSGGETSAKRMKH